MYQPSHPYPPTALKALSNDERSLLSLVGGFPGAWMLLEDAPSGSTLMLPFDVATYLDQHTEQPTSDVKRGGVAIQLTDHGKALYAELKSALATDRNAAMVQRSGSARGRKSRAVISSARENAMIIDGAYWDLDDIWSGRNAPRFLSLDCPTCGAEVDEPCRDSDGDRRRRHPSRARMIGEAYLAWCAQATPEQVMMDALAESHEVLRLTRREYQRAVEVANAPSGNHGGAIASWLEDIHEDVEMRMSAAADAC